MKSKCLLVFIVVLMIACQSKEEKITETELDLSVSTMDMSAPAACSAPSS